MSEIAHLQARVDRLETICAAAYQLAGIVGAPLRFLDALALHDDVDVEALLPVTLDECDAGRLETALRGVQSCSTCEACRGAARLAPESPLSSKAEAPT